MSQNVKNLLEAYHRRMEQAYTVEHVNGTYEITTPFLDRHNDHLQVYVVPDTDSIRLSDEGYILGDLAACGCPMDTPARKQMLNGIVDGFGIQRLRDELYTTATATDFPRKMHMLTQAMLAVNDLFFVAKRHVTNLFADDVRSFLEACGVRYSPNVEFKGKSGLHHRFDYLIPKSTTRPERIIRAINNPSRSDVTTFLFAWMDTIDVRPVQSIAYAMLNDRERTPSHDVTKPFAQYRIRVVNWGERQQFVDELVG